MYRQIYFLEYIFNMAQLLAQLLELGERMGYQGKELRNSPPFLSLQRDVEAIERDESTIARDEQRQEKEREHKLEMRRLELEAARLQGRGDFHNNQQHSRASAPKLPIFHQERDGLDAYLGRFERYAEAQNWLRDQWCTNLSALLTGKALEAYYQLDTDDAGNYDKLKEALLRRFLLNADGFRARFYTCKAEKGESGAQFMTRMGRYLDRSMELTGTARDYQSLKCLIIKDRFMQACYPELATHLKEDRKLKTLEEVYIVADSYLEAHGGG